MNVFPIKRTTINALPNKVVSSRTMNYFKYHVPARTNTCQQILRMFELTGIATIEAVHCFNDEQTVVGQRVAGTGHNGLFDYLLQPCSSITTTITK